MKNFIIIILLVIIGALLYLGLTGSFCHLEYIKPENTDLIPSYLGVI